MRITGDSGYARGMWLAETSEAFVTHPWHYWLAVFLAIPTVLAVLGIVGGYFFKVTRQRYPRGVEE